MQLSVTACHCVDLRRPLQARVLILLDYVPFAMILFAYVFDPKPEMVRTLLAEKLL